ncbi:MAG TPA: hypothetical protein DDX19_09395 [Rhodopirellula baltica]|uniref:Uncharacterized protein n=1 Tax=Rhodopirellula baltica (strain DSM 10527 / NCIMB 13988 / SH1) TaxID=243090 RepID=Q7UU12_RHOBA|nr:hypothetical protein-transmembrane prediction [Rhodopirellula baltica SH 1]HBE62938.1 hypothetical protein [Rhodopirellula baltica]
MRPKLLSESEPLHTESNPYRSPETIPIASTESRSTTCPVCDHPISRLRLVFPRCKCDVCGRRLRLKNSWWASLLSTLTAIACFASMLYFRAIPPSKPILFGLHAFVFLCLGTIWFHVFGTPALSTWKGAASRTVLERERRQFQDELTAVDAD